MKKAFVVSLFIVLIGIGFMVRNLDFGLVFAQYAPDIQNVQAGVTVGGSLGAINVSCSPINFTQGSWGITPGTGGEANPKRNGCNNDNIRVNLNPAGNNVVWNLSINATDMVDGLGHFIPVDEITFNSTCMSGAGISALTSLSNGLQYACTDVPYNEWGNISFFLNVPPGQYNNTYYGNVTLYANSTFAETEPRNRSLALVDDTTVLIERTIEIVWGGTPISFATVAAGDPANATDAESGWPSNITSTSVTNIFVELYLNGTDFQNTTQAIPWNLGFCLNGNCSFESENVSYSNAVTLDDWPSSILDLSNVFGSSPGGDFPNWGGLNFGNSTTKNVSWNISVPGGMPAADYYAIIWAKAVDVGETP